ncbi:UDP-3-O-acyl-N-acetylglucosamine deacetylase [Alginatibacterium sediminis]|uniref:UDP-3-O-acyl-N-acetylglucosamine deacetylase n=1 Tax=Alginatibacterium sediminis TaxID=2164068 RepID=A0A420E8R9_9ALTE|nr:UDP-3-O-acyl-N-acetylglucosamine deacetylase [Alginatibacterium sediminis]RKF15879.1 UDP-3-O-acyl-N-acetylglucosamine deacetylase [Alginatibacterium sediminis]
MIKQRTIGRYTQATGVGLHSGKKVTIAFNPAPVDSGIVFRRNDLNPPVDIPADANLVKDTTLCTGLVDPQQNRIATVEHLLAAIAALGIDNLLIEVDAAEIPIMDGSASPFVFLLQSAGLQEQSKAKKFIKITKAIRVELEDKWAELLPHPSGFKIDFTIDFEHPAMEGRNQHVSMDLSTDAFVKELSRARTFGFMRDIEYLQSHNLALGGSLENAIVLDDFRILNEDGLRYDDEFVKHKVLDAIGDLYLTGHNILGHLRAFKSGHALNNALARALLAQQESWEFVTFEQTQAQTQNLFEPVFAY